MLDCRSMRQVTAGAALLAVLSGCGGQRMVAPSVTTAPSSSATTTLAHAQGVLCDNNGGAEAGAICAVAGTSSTLATVPFTVSRSGTIQIAAITRPLGFEEYPLFRLTCDGHDNHLSAVSGKAAVQPDWFKTVPGVAPTMGAVDNEFAVDAPLAANSSCELTFSFNLEPERLPYTPYDLTITTDAR